MKVENQELRKRKYEIGFVLKTENAPYIMQSLISRGFVILTENPLEKIQLAYPINKESYAYFGYSHFEGDPAAIKSLKEDFRLNPEVLRYLIITPPFVKKPAWRKPASARTSEETRFTLPAQAGPSAGKAESILTNEALEKKIKELV